MSLQTLSAWAPLKCLLLLLCDRRQLCSVTSVTLICRCAWRKSAFAYAKKLQPWLTPEQLGVVGFHRFPFVPWIMLLLTSRSLTSANGHHS